MKPAFIITEQYGYLGNRLVLSAQFMATAIEHGARVWNPAFDEYRRYFKTTSQDVFCRFPARPSVVFRSESLNARACAAVKRLAAYVRSRRPHPRVRTIEFPRQATDHLISRLMFSLDHPAFTALLEQKPIIFFRGYYFYDRTNVIRHAAAIRQYFEPLDQHQEAVARLIAKARREGDVVVGVHVRRGDMKAWMGGQFYWDSPQYHGIMSSMRALFPQRKVAFIVCSNDSLSAEEFPGLSITIGTGHVIEDMYAFAQCDYIIGPFSTYSGWSSFYGNVPLFCLTDPRQDISLEHFHVITEPYSDLSANINLRNIDITEAVLADEYRSAIDQNTELNVITTPSH